MSSFYAYSFFQSLPKMVLWPFSYSPPILFGGQSLSSSRCFVPYDATSLPKVLPSPTPIAATGRLSKKTSPNYRQAILLIIHAMTAVTRIILLNLLWPSPSSQNSSRPELTVYGRSSKRNLSRRTVTISSRFVAIFRYFPRLN